MKEQFVTYEIALALKELGFDEDCLAGYNVNENHPLEMFNKPYLTLPRNKTGEVLTYKSNTYVLKAPLWQQVIDWLSSEKDIHIIFTVNPYEQNTDDIFGYKIYTTDKTLGGLECMVNMDGYSYPKDTCRKQSVLKAIEHINKTK